MASMSKKHRATLRGCVRLCFSSLSLFQSTKAISMNPSVHGRNLTPSHTLVRPQSHSLQEALVRGQRTHDPAKCCGPDVQKQEGDDRLQPSFTKNCAPQKSTAPPSCQIPCVIREPSARRLDHWSSFPWQPAL